MRYTYTAVITPEDGKCYVKIPDIPGCITTGKDLDEIGRASCRERV